MNFMKTSEKSMGETTKVSRAWFQLTRFVDKGYAVAVSKLGRRFHVRAVRLEQIVEAESATIAEAISEAFEKVGKKTDE
jgi:hypothetical protein